MREERVVLLCVRSNGARIFIAFTVAYLVCVTPQPAGAQAWIGLDAWYLNGTHFESSGSVHDAFIVPNFQIGAGGNRLQVRAEGIPTFGITSAPSDPNLPSTSEVGLVDGSLLYAFDKHSRFWLGFGGLVINQRTELPPQPSPFEYQTEASRVAGARYEARIKLPINSNTLVLDFAGMPVLHGTYFANNCRFCYPPEFSTPERGAMTDASTLFELPRGRSMLAFGVRFINYWADYTEYHAPADRDAGLGLILRYTYSFVR